MPRRPADARIASRNSPERSAAMPIVLPVAMVATFLAAMVTIKLYIAPLIWHEAGWLGVAVTIVACLAAGRALED